MNFMEKLKENHKIVLSDFIKESGRTAEELRRAQAILLLSEGSGERMLLLLTGLKRNTVVKIRKRFLKQGITSLESKRKDKKPRSLLTKNQRTEIAEMLATKSPRNYGWDWDYWTPSILGKLILELYCVKYKSKTPIYLIFKQSKFTYHKPDKVYAKRDQAAIDKWKVENGSIIKQALEDENCVVLVEDEMILTSQTTLQKIWLPQGEQPKIVCSNVRKRCSFYGFLDIKTGIQHAFKAEKQTSAISADFLKKICNHYKKKTVLLIWDNAPWHKGEAMRSFLGICSNLKIINFPPYAPDENPQEHVWKAARTNTTHNTFISDINTTARQFLDYLNNTTFKYQFFGFTAP